MQNQTQTQKKNGKGLPLLLAHLRRKPLCLVYYTSLTEPKLKTMPFKHTGSAIKPHGLDYYSCSIDKFHTAIKEAQGNQLFKLDKTNLHLWCMRLQDRPLTLVTNQNQRLYTWGYCWPRYYGLPDHGVRSPCLRDTSCQMRSPAACQRAGWLWSGHHASVSKDASAKNTATFQ